VRESQKERGQEGDEWQIKERIIGKVRSTKYILFSIYFDFKSN
jgi:hypothetical protein